MRRSWVGLNGPWPLMRTYQDSGRVPKPWASSSRAFTYLWVHR
jgi:hypothetical protein